MAAANHDDCDVTTALLDLFVYAPIGLVLDAETMTPELARRGRQNTAAARHLGEYAVKRGLTKLEEIMSQAAPDGRADVAPTERDAGNADTGDHASSADPDDSHNASEIRQQEAGPSVEDLAIPDYDLLAASQVVKRLDGLSPEQLELVRRYESAMRDRRTILHKIARLQS